MADVRLPSTDLTLTPPALAGLAAAILLLLGLAVLAVRGGDGDAVSLSQTTDQTAPAGSGTAPQPGAGDPAADASALPGTPAVPPAGGPGTEGESGAEEPPAEGAADAPPPIELVLPPGSCINDDGRAADVNSVESVDCEIEHTGEVFAATRIDLPPEAPYPGQTVLQGDSRELCQGTAFENYMGSPYAESRFFAYALLPTAETWAAGDRDVACVLYDVRGPLVGSQQGTRQ
ncbi:hypothetical protein BH23ACT9_BH23ACT9_29350 [soil metagenome]